MSSGPRLKNTKAERYLFGGGGGAQSLQNDDIIIALAFDSQAVIFFVYGNNGVHRILQQDYTQEYT